MVFELTRQRVIIYSIVVVLAVVLIGVLLYTQVVSNRQAPVPTPVVSVGGLRADEVQQTFDVHILKDPAYMSLDHSLVGAGRIPVPVPATRGKPNLFGS